MRWATLAVITLALAVLGGTLAWAALDLRRRVDAQVVERNGEVLDAVTQMQHLNDQAAGSTVASLSDPGEQYQLALNVSRLRNVLGVRLFSAGGKFVNAVPAYITEQTLTDADLARLQKLEPVTHFFPRARMQEQDLLADTNDPTTALLLVEVPLRADDQQHLAGVIQFLVDGSSLARQLTALDQNLALKFFLAFIVGAGLLVAGVGMTLRRLQAANRQLAERTQNLLEANRELALAARTSAVGAVASHLIHGLKNPLSGLRHFVGNHNSENSAESDADWAAALKTTQRMEELVNRVVRVLQEQQNAVKYEISLTELAGMLAQRAKPVAELAGVCLDTMIQFDRTLSNREADLILLILENLVQNAIEATPRGKQVKVWMSSDDTTMILEVRDQGSGLPAALVTQLFTPCVSSKKGGGGIGLAICKQLAQSLGARLELAVNGPTGCVFRLVVPQPNARSTVFELKRTLAATH
jgi:signal transduction histidine kinase